MKKIFVILSLLFFVWRYIIPAFLAKEPNKALAPEKYEEEPVNNVPESDEAPKNEVVEKVKEEGLVNINEASLDELLLITGVGQDLAEKILACKEEVGSFKGEKDLLQVKGIGEKKLEQMSGSFTL
ncbi:helix-hairpin-helix domain-containing protein [Paenalkalicoccus suaedae]|uniref:Helix-hairpin-helix domain-containing protein n=1 Tax=Paenalkalicoccus suaedae TaxID=2592382 RepID=A0A859FHS8_9BACI|nr:helix-hairpin-helix domain-containing protein [Paenalkalicoccus suaedae]QKS72398.1 helix-hairpin-helix domain-containing protein [Paenalkalicoccus suaedae]